MQHAKSPLSRALSALNVLRYNSLVEHDGGRLSRHRQIRELTFGYGFVNLNFGAGSGFALGSCAPPGPGSPIMRAASNQGAQIS
jgi:hypothetical protein